MSSARGFMRVYSLQNVQCETESHDNETESQETPSHKSQELVVGYQTAASCRSVPPTLYFGEVSLEYRRMKKMAGRMNDIVVLPVDPTKPRTCKPDWNSVSYTTNTTIRRLTVSS